MTKNPLSQHRERIDQIDQEILQLVKARAEQAVAIGKLKAEVVYRPEREAEILRKIKKLNTSALSDEAVVNIFREVISACRALETPLTIAYLGPVGTYSETAAMKQFGHAVQLQACASIDEVFRAVETKQSDYAVVPVENSTEGAVGRALDLLVQTPLKVVGEVTLRIEQQLLRKQNNLKGIKKIYSHPQSLAQCHHWLSDNLPGVACVAVASNAEAARLAAADKNSAAIAGAMAAAHYKLQIIKHNIEDNADNTTRFLVLGSQAVAPSGQDKTSLIVTAKNQAGAVHDLLAPFATQHVSMTRFESRPAHTALWEYLFFIDIEGHCLDNNVAQALTQLQEKAAFLKVLGSYPVAVS